MAVTEETVKMVATVLAAAVSVVYGLVMGQTGFVSIGMAALAAPQGLRFTLRARGAQVQVEKSG